jgi:uncharacterized repeat protein (TIGR01451 family)
MQFLGSSNSADTSTKGEIKFNNINVFNTTNDNLAINLRFRVFSTTRLGDSINITSDFVFYNAKVDSFPINNVDTIKAIVVGAYDPNDKEVEPKGDITALPDKFTYTVRFQNTGTDTAFNVVVRDTLSNVLNPLSIKPIAASHPYRFVLKENGIIEWHFNNILLPDSFRNERASHGFVKFSIEANKGISFNIGSKFENKAGIYFDYNSPIITNTARNTVIKLISKTNDLNEEKLFIYPNPAKDVLIVELENAPLNNLPIEIYNSLGQLLIKAQLNEKINTIKLNSFNSGVYFIKITNGQHFQTINFVVSQ